MLERANAVRVALYGALALMGALVLAWSFGGAELARQALLTWRHRADPRAASVVLVVLDTVRADRLSICGYERPTTPNLEALVAAGAAFTCQAYAPSPWTLPSHASFFTGVDVPGHHAHTDRVTDSSQALELERLGVRPPGPLGVGQAYPLDETLPTLAERMAERGYQTAAVSANPVVSAATGLARGFHHFRDRGGLIYGDALLAELRQLLRYDLDPSGKPLFLFVNISDAHNPWAGVPDDLGWLPPTRGYTYDKGSEGLFERYTRGELADAESEAYLRRVGDLYDYAVFRADRVMGEVLRMIEDHGWTRRGLRLVVVSDHGEFLGEHRRLDHGQHVWQEVVRVPLVYLDDAGAIRLSEPLSALHVFDLVLEGQLPEEPVPPHALVYGLRSAEAAEDARPSLVGTVLQGSAKYVSEDGRCQRFDLREDHDEQRPLPCSDPPQALGELLRRGGEEVVRQPGSSEAVLDALRAVGYID